MAAIFRQSGTSHLAWVGFLLLLWCLPRWGEAVPTTIDKPHNTPLEASLAIMRDALQQALQLRFAAAYERAKSLLGEEQTALEAALVHGMIAYFQARWQTRPVPVPAQKGQEFFVTLLDKGQPQLAKAPRDVRLKLLLGTASIFRALWPHDGRVGVPGNNAQGRAWLQQALLTEAALSDAHFGLGLAYFVLLNMPPWARLLAQTGGESSAEDAIHHLQRAATTGYFSRDVARTFLLQLYEVEKRYPEAITLGQELLETFTDNGYYALLTGRSQYAYGHYTACAATFGKLVAAVNLTPDMLAHRDDRFDLYYFFARALTETGEYSAAFQAFRQAINVDPAAQKDESLWAKYYLATLYERRGDLKTARQTYNTLLRGRNVGTLHQQIHQRLAHLP
jgi:tetratricopeptide (TPR) repeat protein